LGEDASAYRCRPIPSAAGGNVTASAAEAHRVLRGTRRAFVRPSLLRHGGQRPGRHGRLPVSGYGRATGWNAALLQRLLTRAALFRHRNGVRLASQSSRGSDATPPHRAAGVAPSSAFSSAVSTDAPSGPHALRRPEP
jgi:hypothetical protein